MILDEEKNELVELKGSITSRVGFQQIVGDFGKKIIKGKVILPENCLN